MNAILGNLYLHLNKKHFYILCAFYPITLSRDTRFPTMWYVRPAKSQISLRIRAVWSEPCWTANFTFRKFYTVKNWYKFLRAREKLVPVRHIFHTNISHFVKFAHVVKLYVACMRNLHRDKIAPKSAALAFDSNSSHICQDIITWFKQVTDKFHKFYSWKIWDRSKTAYQLYEPRREKTFLWGSFSRFASLCPWRYRNKH